jgi:hypothetical protein
MDEQQILDRCWSVMEEFGVYLDPDDTDIKHLTYFSDKVLKLRQMKAQQQKSGGNTQMPKKRK